MNIKELMIKGLQDGKLNFDLYPLAVQNGYTGKYKTFKNFMGKLRHEIQMHDVPQVHSHILSNTPQNKNGSAQDILIKLRAKKLINILDLCNEFDCAPRHVIESVKSLQDSGYEIFIDETKIFLNTFGSIPPIKNITSIGETEVIFGVASDLHFGSKECQITALSEFCNECKKRGIKHILVPGDIVAGYNVYPGQIQDLYAVSAEEQLNSVLANLSPEFEWYVLGGNHDYSFMSRGGGYNIVNALQRRSNNIHYIGFDSAKVPILKGIDAILLHPSGGIPYSASYRLQKNIEQVAYSELYNMTGGFKGTPSVRFVLSGHLHIQIQGMFGSIFGAQCGCFEGQTNYLKRKGLVPQIGGYIIQASLNSNGFIRNFDAKFYLYDECMDDYKGYSHTPYPALNKVDETLKPLFG